MHILDTQTISTDAGEYSVQFMLDECPDQPYDEGFSLYVITGRNYSTFTVDHISETDSDADVQVNIVSAIEAHARRDDRWGWQFRSGAAILRYLTLTGHHGATLVDDQYRPVDPSTDRFDRVYGVAWAPADATDPAQYVKIVLAQWESWADGDVFGWNLFDPEGNEIDTCWGYYGYNHSLLGDSERAYIMEQVVDAARGDASDRADRANLVGAGFVGIV